LLILWPMYSNSALYTVQLPYITRKFYVYQVWSRKCAWA